MLHLYATTNNICAHMVIKYEFNVVKAGGLAKAAKLFFLQCRLCVECIHLFGHRNLHQVFAGVFFFFFVCLFVCVQNDTKSMAWIWMKLSDNMGIRMRNRLLNFGCDPEHHLEIVLRQ